MKISMKLSNYYSPEKAKEMNAVMFFDTFRRLIRLEKQAVINEVLEMLDDSKDLEDLKNRIIKYYALKPHKE